MAEDIKTSTYPIGELFEYKFKGDKNGGFMGGMSMIAKCIGKETGSPFVKMIVISTYPVKIPYWNAGEIVRRTNLSNWEKL